MMSVRRATAAGALALVAFLSFGLGAFSAGRAGQAFEAEATLRALRAEVAAMKQAQTLTPFGTSGREPAAVPASSELRATVVDEVKRQLREEMGLLPLQLLRDRKE
ncbi:MAG: hypothetical protein HY654_09065, partial [Acidobacteria bacterium]|nr:hypothetical protein [Acidobacteriota bacterium]